MIISDTSPQSHALDWTDAEPSYYSYYLENLDAAPCGGASTGTYGWAYSDSADLSSGSPHLYSNTGLTAKIPTGYYANEFEDDENYIGFHYHQTNGVTGYQVCQV